MLAPVLLLGLFLSGLIHVFISRHAVVRWLQKDNLQAISASAAIGVPIPLCSCSVLPVVAEMRNKGASRSACMSFLITAPETGVDSILVTHAFFGPIAAITRPIVSFITAVIAGVSCAATTRRDEFSEAQSANLVDECGMDVCSSAAEGSSDPCTGEPSGIHDYLVPEEKDCYISFSKLRTATAQSLKSLIRGIKSLQALRFLRPSTSSDSAISVRNILPDESQTKESLSLQKVVRHVFRYGFINIADDILFALLVGLALGGIIYVVLPGDLMNNQYAQWLSYPVMLIVAVPLYICASASTPIAASLVAKGLSPGAALIFLMSGPCTNTATISVIFNQFGPKFTSIYVGVVMGVTLAMGIGIDMLLMASGFSIVANLNPDHSHAIQTIQYICVAIFFGLVIWRFRNGAFESGWREMFSNFKTLSNGRSST